MQPASRSPRARGLVLLLAAVVLTFSASLAWRARSQRRVDERATLSAELEDGDLVFQQSASDQADAIREVTGSRFTHVGIVFHRRGEPQVLEAIGPVRYTPFRLFAGRGVGGEVVVRRLRARDARLDVRGVRRLRREAEAMLGRPYDLRFEASDERMYCSELVWKAYERALGIRLGEPTPLTELELEGPEARALVRERFRGREVPRGAAIITPRAVLESEELLAVP